MNKTKILKAVKVIALTLLIFLGVIATSVYWYMDTAKAAERFCERIILNTDFDLLKEEAKEKEFKINKKGSESQNKLLYVFVKLPNGESRCLVFVKNNTIVEKKYILNL